MEEARREPGDDELDRSRDASLMRDLPPRAMAPRPIPPRPARPVARPVARPAARPMARPAAVVRLEAQANGIINMELDSESKVRHLHNIINAVARQVRDEREKHRLTQYLNDEIRRLGGELDGGGGKDDIVVIYNIPTGPKTLVHILYIIIS